MATSEMPTSPAPMSRRKASTTADTVKTSGDFIYKVGEIRGGEREFPTGSLEDCAYRLSVVEDCTGGGRSQLVASVDLEPLATTPEAMFVHGDVLLLYGSAEVTYDDTAEKSDDYDYCTKGEPATVVLTFDVTDPTSPILLRRQIIEGSYVSARKVDSYAYLVLAKRTYWAEVAPRAACPSTRARTRPGWSRPWRATRSCSSIHAGSTDEKLGRLYGGGRD